MVDIFDKFLEKITSGDTARRARRVAIQAMFLMFVCVLAFVLLALSTVDLKIKAEGEVVGFEGELCPIVRIVIESKYIDKIGKGQQVIVKNKITSQNYDGFALREIEQSQTEEDGYFVAIAACREPLQPDNDLKVNTAVKVSIVFEKKIVGKILLKKEI